MDCSSLRLTSRVVVSHVRVRYSQIVSDTYKVFTTIEVRAVFVVLHFFFICVFRRGDAVADGQVGVARGLQLT
jgi:hypothetical protein